VIIDPIDAQADALAQIARARLHALPPRAVPMKPARPPGADARLAGPVSTLVLALLTAAALYACYGA
jgi:hypothetical protein